MTSSETKLLRAQDASLFMCILGVVGGAMLLLLLWSIWDHQPPNPQNALVLRKFLGWGGAVSICVGAVFGFRWHILKGRYNARYVREFEG